MHSLTKAPHILTSFLSLQKVGNVILENRVRQWLHNHSISLFVVYYSNKLAGFNSTAIPSEKPRAGFLLGGAENLHNISNTAEDVEA